MLLKKKLQCEPGFRNVASLIAQKLDEKKKKNIIRKDIMLSFVVYIQ